MRPILVLAALGTAISLAACATTPPARYGAACNPDGTNCTPVVCNNKDECAAIPYVYAGPNGYAVSANGYYTTGYSRPMKVCDQWGNNCYWVPRSADGHYYDRTGAVISIGP